MENIEKNVAEQTSLMVAEETGFIGELQESKQMFCSVDITKDENKQFAFNLMNTADKRIRDCVNEVINLKDVFVEVVTLMNDKTGELVDCPRVVIADDKQVTYQCVSVGFYNGLKKLIAIYGLPTYVKPIPIKIKQISKGEKQILTFELISMKKK